MTTTLELVPWAVGRTVQAYPRKSDLILPDMPPPQIPAVGSAVVAADQTLTYELNPGVYWAIAELTEGQRDYRYLMFSIPAPASSVVALSSGSLLFSQEFAVLDESFPWVAPDASRLSRASLLVETAATEAVDIAAVALNGAQIAVLSLLGGQMAAAEAMTADLTAGDAVTVVRLSLDCGACQVQIDRSA